MRCSTCGEFLQPGQTRCPTCGTRTRGTTDTPAPLNQRVDPRLHQCPRCGNYGTGISYFSRPGHIALLVGVSFFTSGVGGFVYWLARRKHRVCGNCGFSWERVIQAGLQHGESGEDRGLPVEREKELLPSAGVKRRVLGTLAILFGTFLVLLGVVEAEIGAALTGAMFGAAGTGMFYWGWKGQEARRQALMTGLQRKVLRLATRKGGSLTVTEVAADLNLSLAVAEKVLVGMDDGFRVRSDITKEGVIVYEFPEVQHRARLRSGPQEGPGEGASASA